MRRKSRSKKKAIVMVASAVALMVGSLGATLAYLTDTSSVTNTFTVGNVDITLDETLVNEDGKPVDKDGNEILVDESGNPTEEGKELVRQEEGEGNEYHLVPGEKYLKDPMITVAEGSEESYVRMILTVTNASAVQELIDNNSLTDFADLLKGWDETVWEYYGYTADAEENTISFEFRYFETVDGYKLNEETNAEEAAEVVLAPLFTHLVVPGTATGEELAALYGDPETEDDDFKMIVEGHAIQVAGFEASETVTAEEAEDAAWAAFDQQLETKGATTTTTEETP